MLQDLINCSRRLQGIHGTNFVIEKGTRILIPADAIHYDPDIYPEPDKFDPEEINKRHPLTFLPFGEGPRNFIGLWFGEMQATYKLMLRNFMFSVCEKTTIEIDTTKFLLGSKGGIYLKVNKM